MQCFQNGLAYSATVINYERTVLDNSGLYYKIFTIVMTNTIKL